LALITTESTTAAPINTCKPLPVDDPDDAAPATALPEIAPTVAVPERLPAWSVVVALPLTVVAVWGFSVPSVVVKVTLVPFCTGVPPDSSTIAVMVAEPPSGMASALAYRVMVELLGASSGTFSHVEEKIENAASSTSEKGARRGNRRRWSAGEGGIMENLNMVNP
jgi:hypothetical protein